MYNSATNAFKTAHNKTGRTFCAKLSFTSGIELPNDKCEIFSVKLARGNETADDITFGEVSSAIATVEMSYDSSVMASVKEGMTVNHHLGLNTSSSTEYVPMGEFKVLSCVRNGANVTLTLADKLYESDTVYSSTLTFPNTANNIVSEICNSLGISGFEATGITLSSMQISQAPANLTKRQMLSYIASYFGCNAYIGRTGKLVFGWYDFSSVVTVTDDEIDMPKLGDAITIKALACAIDSQTVITSGTGRAMTFENPYMTQSRLDSLRREFSYVSAEINQLVGSVLIDFDVLSYNGSLIPVMSSELMFDGGVRLVMKAVGKSEEEAAKKTVSPMDVLVEQVKKYADDVVKHSSDIMNGVNGGYKIEKYDADGNPYATLWMDAPTEKQATHCILINKDGIGFGTKNSGADTWTYTMAWLIDGTFNTQFVTANELSITGSLKNSKSSKIDNSTVEMDYELSNNIKIPSINNTTFDAVGLQLSSKDKNKNNNKAYFTNWGAFFDVSSDDAAVSSFINSILAALGNLNYYNGTGFLVKKGNNEIAGDPDVGMRASKGFKSPAAFESETGFSVNGDWCLTKQDGVFSNVHNASIADCNEPSKDVTSINSYHKGVCVDLFSSTTSNAPFANSVGYLVTFNYFSETAKYGVQLGIRYRDNEIKMRTYNTVNSSDGKTAVWSDWSSIFATRSEITSANATLKSELKNEMSSTYATKVKLEDAVSIINKAITGLETDISNLEDKFLLNFNSSTNIGYELSASGVLTQWGSVTLSASTPKKITFPRSFSNTVYGLSFTPYYRKGSVYYTAIATDSITIRSDDIASDTTFRWIAIGKGA